ncbi:MAG TPA: hypothetical protein VHQ02_12795 [Usitatibacter sp.]|jgi:hypothetical protein|nr:hypothetical protein [Usitatibacter sp.]
MKRPALALLCLALAVLATRAATVSIANGPGLLTLQIGSGAATINQVNISVPGASVGNGTAVASASVTPADPTCPANSVLIDAQARSQNNKPRTATLTADSSTPLSSGGFTIPFSQVAWTSTTPGGGPNGCLNAPITIPSGVFTGAAGQSLVSFGTAQRACVCAQFRYLNQSIVSAGTYTGRVTYTLAMP